MTAFGGLLAIFDDPQVSLLIVWGCLRKKNMGRFHARLLWWHILARLPSKTHSISRYTVWFNVSESIGGRMRDSSWSWARPVFCLQESFVEAIGRHVVLF